MTPVKAKIGHHKRGERANPDRPGRDFRAPGDGDDFERKIGRNRERDEQDEGRKEGADEIEPEVA